MKYIALAAVALASQVAPLFAGEMVASKEVVVQPPPPPVEELYRDREFQVDIFGLYSTQWDDNTQGIRDHAWGGGLGFNYFFLRYVGVGLEGELFKPSGEDTDPAGKFSLNLFLRYPIGNSGFSPYVFAGGGIFINSVDRLDFGELGEDPDRKSDDVLWAGQFGGGLEYRFTRNFGIFTDARYDLLEKTRNDYMTVRAGVRLAF
jgi:hypothetical protein